MPRLDLTAAAFIAGLAAASASFAQPTPSLSERDVRRHETLIEAIVAVAEATPIELVPGLVRARFGAGDVEAIPLLRVSNPPLARLSFTIEGVPYTRLYVPAFREARFERLPGAAHAPR